MNPSVSGVAAGDARSDTVVDPRRREAPSHGRPGRHSESDRGPTPVNTGVGGEDRGTGERERQLVSLRFFIRFAQTTARRGRAGTLTGMPELVTRRGKIDRAGTIVPGPHYFAHFTGERRVLKDAFYDQLSVESGFRIADLLLEQYYRRVSPIAGLFLSKRNRTTMSTDVTPTTEAAPKLSPVEGMKERSRYLRGNLAEEVASAADHLSEEAKNILKFHGSYQQEDRDARKNRAKPGVGKAYMFMIRLKLPGGRLTPEQYLAMDDIAGRHANGTLRFTTRQSIQFHGVLKSNLKQTMADINGAMVSTLGACGDVNRNVVACPAPLGDPARKQMQQLAAEIAAHLAPRSGNQAYHEIWLNGEKVGTDLPPEEAEPIYGKVYLPRKFKTGFALPHDNCTDLLAQCLGFLAITEGGKPVGYNM